MFDQSTGETVRDPLQNVAGMSDVRDGQDSAVVYAIDGDLAYVKTQQGAAAWNTATGDLTFLDPEANGFTITDAKNGLIAYQPAGAEDEPVIRVGDTLDSGTEIPLWAAYDLSPDGRYLMGEAESDDVRIFDTGTGEAMPKDDYGYAYFGGYQWIDSEHYAALGFHEPIESDLVDILSCTVVTGVCTPRGRGRRLDGRRPRDPDRDLQQLTVDRRRRRRHGADVLDDAARQRLRRETDPLEDHARAWRGRGTPAGCRAAGTAW